MKNSSSTSANSDFPKTRVQILAESLGLVVDLTRAANCPQREISDVPQPDIDFSSPSICPSPYREPSSLTTEFPDAVRLPRLLYDTARQNGNKPLEAWALKHFWQEFDIAEWERFQLERSDHDDLDALALITSHEGTQEHKEHARDVRLKQQQQCRQAPRFSTLQHSVPPRIHRNIQCSRRVPSSPFRIPDVSPGSPALLSPVSPTLLSTTTFPSHVAPRTPQSKPSDARPSRLSIRIPSLAQVRAQTVGIQMTSPDVAITIPPAPVPAILELPSTSCDVVLHDTCSQLSSPELTDLELRYPEDESDSSNYSSAPMTPPDDRYISRRWTTLGKRKYIDEASIKGIGPSTKTHKKSGSDRQVVRRRSARANKAGRR